MVDYKAGSCVWDFAEVFSEGVIDLDLLVGLVRGIVGSEAGGFEEEAVGQLREGLAAGFYDDVGAGNIFGMEPEITAVCDFEGYFFILVVVFSDENFIAIR